MQIPHPDKLDGHVVPRITRTFIQNFASVKANRTTQKKRSTTGQITKKLPETNSLPASKSFPFNSTEEVCHQPWSARTFIQIQFVSF